MSESVLSLQDSIESLRTELRRALEGTDSLRKALSISDEIARDYRKEVERLTAERDLHKAYAVESQRRFDAARAENADLRRRLHMATTDGGESPSAPTLPHIHCFSVNCAYCQVPKVKVERLQTRLDCNQCGKGTDIEEDGTCYYCGADPIVVHWAGKPPPPATLDRDAPQQTTEGKPHAG